MAKPIEFRPVAEPDEEQVRRNLENAPVKHAEAVLDAYKTLQTLHDTDTLEFVRGVFGAGDKVISEVVSVASSPQSMRAIRNLLILSNLLGSVDPETMHEMFQNVTTSVTKEKGAKPPSMFGLARRLLSADARRGLATSIAALEGVGRSMRPNEER